MESYRRLPPPSETQLRDGKENLNDHFTSSQPIWWVTTVYPMLHSVFHSGSISRKRGFEINIDLKMISKTIRESTVLAPIKAAETIKKLFFEPLGYQIKNA